MKVVSKLKIYGYVSSVFWVFLLLPAGVGALELDVDEVYLDSEPGQYVEMSVAAMELELALEGSEVEEGESVKAEVYQEDTAYEAELWREYVEPYEEWGYAEDEGGLVDVEVVDKQSVKNDIESVSESGSVAVGYNTEAGDAISGDALAVVNVLNLLQSGWSVDEILLFVADIDEDIEGDFIIDLEALASSLAASSMWPELNVNASTDASIDNQIDVKAKSGDALVEANTKAGSAISGDALAIVQVLNLINSSIASGQSFLGMINIYGDFRGDVLLPKELAEYYLQGADSGVISPTHQSVNSAQSVTNTVSVVAESGDASVSNNTVAGDAISGEAVTDVFMYSLLGQHVSAKNVLLVYVNVFGEWIGLIMDAPAGSRAAMLGGGVGSDVIDAVDVSSELSINNSITATAKTGEARVVNNTEAGDAISGNAYAGVSLLNIVNSSFSVSDWFGVLFINVFGNWEGNVGVKDPGQEPDAPEDDCKQPDGADSVGGSDRPSSSDKGAEGKTDASGGVLGSVFRFVPSGSQYCPSDVYAKGYVLASQSGAIGLSGGAGSSSEDSGSVGLSSRDQSSSPGLIERNPFGSSDEQSRSAVPFVLIAIGMTILAADRVSAIKQRRASEV